MLMMKEGMVNIFFELLSTSIKFLKKSKKYCLSYDHRINNIKNIRYGEKGNDNYYHYIIYDIFTYMVKFIFLFIFIMK
jgi:hypothetical protein